jgi:uncharacterized cupin superfamily protein
MEKITIDDLDNRMAPASVKRPVGSELGAENLAVSYYELAPGESFAFGYHAHADQEEIFHILEGTATFETDAGDVDVESGEVIRFSPGEFQRGSNETDETVRAIAVGAPADAGELTLLRECEPCGERTGQTIEMADDRNALVTLCVECGTETGRFS